MKILILGAGGMIGRKLTAALLRKGDLSGQAIQSMTLADVVKTDAPASAIPLHTVAADLSAPGVAAELIAERPDVVFHLAAIVSGEAEADFEKGYRINLDGTRELFEAVRRVHGADGYRPRVVFTSSVAVFGQPLPPVVPETQVLAPLSSYGTQKAIGELLLADYSRRGFMDGIGIRLPTIVIRPGQPNKAASGFFSGILREPLAGLPATLPVGDDVRHWFASPRRAVEFVLRAAEVDTSGLGVRRTLDMPGLSATVGEAIEALRRAAGDEAVALIRREPDPAVQRIIESWPEAFDPQRARALGFEADASFDEIIRRHLEDEAPATTVRS
ncbi:D-erythronate dehydrogenase [Aureimonas jatrophae]|uniref:Nucleoside-diphosphate-sugar epimerase n=1 Tax=Aureimonas jatrophae TaxID=1166073 RepID=A0A1H0MHL5_9HYPH|nr:D-erythronate dehydrogenase [Aureimonas jatrophae]MBB3952955.1 nucleoside-diphosphate-sugar epimerase [Aureimonas jatrophae]SDO79929.1 Nucleoside-diphosphate-sugar epimerase [Aureimonas jatrophae]